MWHNRDVAGQRWPAADENQGFEVELEAARQARRRGRLDAARRAYSAAFRAAQAADHAPAMAEAALGYCGIWVNEHRAADEFASSQRMLRAAHTAIGEDCVLKSLLTVRMAADACYAGRESPQAVVDAVDAVRRHGDDRSLAEALSLQVHTMLAPRHRIARTRVVDELMESAVAACDEFLVLLALTWRCVDAFLAGDPEAIRLLKTLEARALAADVAVITYTVHSIQMMVCLREGRFDEAEAALDGLVLEGRAAGEVDADTWWAGQLFALRYCQGRIDELVDAAQALAESPALTSFNRVFCAVAAFLSANAGNPDRARAALARVAPFVPPPLGLAESSVWLVTLAAVVEAAHCLRDADLARAAYETLVPHAELPMIGSLAVVCLGSTHRALALCAATFGEHELARQHFECALADNTRLGHLPMLAISRAELGQELRRAGDTERAAGLLADAVESARALGMTGFVERWQLECDQLTSLGPGRCVRAGRVWEIATASGHATISDGVGMRALALLLSNPRRDIAVAEITGAIASGSRQTVLDDAARRALRSRFNELRDDIAHAEADADIERVAQLRHELDELVDSVSGSIDHRGRSRTFPDAVERSRTSTQKALRRVQLAIAEQSPELATGLASSIRTGAICRFDPAPGVPERWIVC